MCFEKNSSCQFVAKSNEIFVCDAPALPRIFGMVRVDPYKLKNRSRFSSLSSSFLTLHQQATKEQQPNHTYHKLTNNIFWPFVPPASNLHLYRDTCDENKVNRTWEKLQKTTTWWWDEVFLCQECFSLCCSASYLAATRSVPQKEVILHQSRRTRIRIRSEVERHGVCLLWLFQKTMRINRLWNW